VRIQPTNILNVFLISTIIVFSNCIFGQSTPQISIPFEIYDNAGGQKILYFGLDQTATNGIDINLGESDLPPYPPTGAFDARWLLPENGFNGSLSSWSDYRFASGFPFTGTVEHRFRYQSAGGATAMFFSWNLPPEITGLIQDLNNGTIVNVQINGSGTYQLNNFATISQLRLMVYYNSIVSSTEDAAKFPNFYFLEQNYPNPFNPKTVISYRLPVSGNVKLKVYDVLGNEVATLVDEEKQAGIYEVEFSAKGGSASGGNAYDLPSGVYFYSLRVGAYFRTKKMVFLK
jgi:hypothetical protein